MLVASPYPNATMAAVAEDVMPHTPRYTRLTESAAIKAAAIRSTTTVTNRKRTSSSLTWCVCNHHTAGTATGVARSAAAIGYLDISMPFAVRRRK